jgi:AcrR family transcriptional regulator
VAATKWVDSSEARRATRHSDHRAARRTAIVVAAAATIAESGIPLRTARVADRAGVPRPHVYRHFDSKEDLGDEVARYAAAALAERVRPALSRSGTPPVIVRGVIAEVVEWADENPNLYRFVAARQRTKAFAVDQSGRHFFMAELSNALTAYVRTQADEASPDGILAGLIGMVDASIIWWLDHRDEDVAHVIDRLARQVWLILGDTATTMNVPIGDDTWLTLPGQQELAPGSHVVSQKYKYHR